MTERELYLKAIDVLKRDGWKKGRANSMTRRPHCILGAIDTAFGSFYNRPPLKSLHDVIGNLVSFNDDPRTKERDVIAALEIAADLAA